MRQCHFCEFCSHPLASLSFLHFLPVDRVTRIPPCIGTFQVDNCTPSRRFTKWQDIQGRINLRESQNASSEEHEERDRRIGNDRNTKRTTFCPTCLAKERRLMTPLLVYERERLGDSQWVFICGSLWKGFVRHWDYGPHPLSKLCFCWVRPRTDLRC